MQILLDEKAITDALAQGAIQPGTVTTSGLTAAAQRILGNKEATTGAIEELTLSQVLDLIGSAAQGDVLFRGSAGWQRLAAGTSGQFLKTLGAGADPAWATAATGGSGSWTLISEQTPTGTGTVSFTSIAATYRDLRLVVRGRGTTAANSVAVTLQFNADTGAHYDYERLGASSTSAVAVQSLAQTSVGIGFIPAASAASGVGDAADATIHDYRGSLQKSLKSLTGPKNNTTSGNISINIISGWWRDTSAITRVDVILAAGNFDTGSVVSLYGGL
jgi:hypothetical protein